MTRHRPTPAARLRGMAVALVTAALALTAHAAAGGAPSGAGAVLLGLLAVTVGAVAATADAATDIRILLALLAVGQLIAHTTLAVVGHDHGSAAPGVAMLTAHALAVLISTVLIATGDRLCRAVCSAMRVVVADVPTLLATAAATPVVGGDQPPQSALLLAASMSHRGPPVSLAP